MEYKSTRLRYIKARTPQDLVSAVESLPFKVEVKGSPVKDGSAWVIFFVLPETQGLDLASVDLTQ